MSDPRYVSNESSDHKEWDDLPDRGGRSSDVLLGALRAQGRDLDERLHQDACRFAEKVAKELEGSVPIAILEEQLAGEGTRHQNPQETRRRWVVILGGGALLLIGAFFFIESQPTDRGPNQTSWLPNDIGSRSVGAGIVNIAVVDPIAWIADFEKLCHSHGVQLFRQELEGGGIRLQAKVPHSNESLVKALAERGVKVPPNGQLSVVVRRLVAQ